MLKLASSPRAAASSLRVFRAAGEESTRFDTAVVTKAVVATCVVFVAAAAVGAVGVPVNAGEAKGAKDVLLKALEPNVRFSTSVPF